MSPKVFILAVLNVVCYFPMTAQSGSPCALPQPYTEQDIANTQECIKNKLNGLYEVLDLTENYMTQAKTKFTSLLAEAGVCKKYQYLLETQPDNLDFQHRISECDFLRENRLKKYLAIKKDYEDMKDNLSALKEQRDMLLDINTIVDEAASLLN